MNTKTIEIVHVRTEDGSRIEKVEHDWDRQCSWVNHDGSHCQMVKSNGYAPSPSISSSGLSICSNH